MKTLKLLVARITRSTVSHTIACVVCVCVGGGGLVMQVSVRDAVQISHPVVECVHQSLQKQ